VAIDRLKAAWQPLTFSGVARFAVASRWRLLSVELFFALLVAVVSVCFVQQAWVPVVDGAIGKMPATGEIRGGQLAWPEGGLLQEEGPFMRIDVTPGGFTNVVETADLVLAFGPSNLRLGSNLGFGLLTLSYPTGWIVSFNKSELEPWWGARSHMVLGGFGLGIILMLLCAWSALGWLYTFPVKIFSANQVGWAGAKKIAIASQMPGAFVMSIGIVIYGLKQIDLVALLMVWCGHLVLPWVYMMFSPILAPKLPKPKKNKPRRQEGKNPFDESSGSSDNPFGVE
jgi:hypothetical protein